MTDQPLTTITVTTAQTEPVVLSQPGEYLVELTQPGAEVKLVGAFQLTGSDNLQVKVTIRHCAPHTRATTTVHGVVQDQARLSLIGRIVIEENCGDSQSFLTERVLLLSDAASAETVPDLEIKTDDVKCSHAASISRIPEPHLFYLMSRGLSRPAAEQLIVDGFLAVE